MADEWLAAVWIVESGSTDVGSLLLVVSGLEVSDGFSTVLTREVLVLCDLRDRLEAGLPLVVFESTTEPDPERGEDRVDRIEELLLASWLDCFTVSCAGRVVEVGSASVLLERGTDSDPW